MVGNRFSRTGLELASDSAGKSFEVNQESEFQNYVCGNIYFSSADIRMRLKKK